MAGQADHTPDPKKILEKGDVFFFYRPRIDSAGAQAVGDLQRFYVVLRPARKRPRIRVLTIGRKRLPEIASHERSWGFVDLVTSSTRVLARLLGDERYQTKTRGTRTLPAARPAGEGVYVFARLGAKLFLAYELELPERPGPVQRALNIAPRGSYAPSIKNPEADTPPNVGLREDAEADYPPQLLREFHGRRFASEDVKLLDYAGAEFVLVGAAPDPEHDLDIALPARHESVESADIFRTLHLPRHGQPIEPLLTGSWQ
jgi:hypothetical protein